jgi:glycine cleavage system transcriptional repressor
LGSGGSLEAVPQFAVTAIGLDRPGIVAAVSGALLELDGNVKDSQMSILQGHFAVMLLVEVPEEVEHTQLADRLGQVRDELGLEAVTVSPVGAGVDAVEPTHVVSVYGADSKGIVHGISAALAGLGVDITDLETKLAGTPGSPVYVMMLEIALGGAALEEVEEALRDAAGTLGVEVSLRELEGEAL